MPLTDEELDEQVKSILAAVVPTIRMVITNHLKAAQGALPAAVAPLELVTQTRRDPEHGGEIQGREAEHKPSPVVVIDDRREAPRQAAGLTPTGRVKRSLDMGCRAAEGCENRSKGPRFSFLCEGHYDRRNAPGLPCQSPTTTNAAEDPADPVVEYGADN